MTTISDHGVQLHFFRSSRAMETHLAVLATTGRAMDENLRADIGEYMLGQVQDNFDHQTLFDGTAMPQSLRALDETGKTLIDRHHLYDSYVYQVTPDGVEIGSNSIYARIHHFGGEAGGRGHRITLDPRPVLGMTDEIERHIGALMIADLQGKEPGALQ